MKNKYKNVYKAVSSLGISAQKAIESLKAFNKMYNALGRPLDVSDHRNSEKRN